MTPKLVLYFCRGAEDEYKILRSFKLAEEILLNRDNWPIFIDLSFKPMIASKACTALRNYPNLPFVSQSLALALSSDDISFIKDLSVTVETTKAFPILSFMGQPVITLEEILPLDLKDKTEILNTEIIDFCDKNLETPLTQFIFSVRLTNIFNKAKIFTIGDILEYSEAAIMRLPNCGRTSLRELKLFLNDQGYQLKGNDTDFNVSPSLTHQDLASPTRVPLNELQKDYDAELPTGDAYHREASIEESPKNIFDNLLSVLETIDARQCTLIKKRLGLGESRKTLEEISTIFGVTRERVRQIEKQAIKAISHPSRGWNPDNIWSHSLKNILAGPHAPITAQKLVLVDERFDFQAFDEAALYNILKTLLSDEVTCYKISYKGETYYSQLSQDNFDATIAGIRSLLPSLEGQPIKEVETTVKGIIPQELTSFFALFLSDALEHSVIEELEEVPTLKFFSLKITAKTIAQRLFNDLKEPVTNEQLHKIISQNYPDAEVRSVLNEVAHLKGVFPMKHGVWGTIKMLNLTATELSQLKTLFTDFFNQLNKDQFHTNEIQAFLEVHNTYFYVKMNSFKISGLLKYFKIGHYVGRNMFTKTENDNSRILIKDVVIQCLREEQKPVKKNVLVEKVKNIRSFDGLLNLGQMPGIVHLGSGYYALETWIIEVTEGGCFYQTNNKNQKLFLDFSSSRPDLAKEWTDTEISTLLNLRNRGFSVPVIAEKMGLTRYAIYSRLKQNGSGDDIRAPELDLFVQPNKREKNSVKLDWTDDRTELLKQMWQDGASASTIATKLGGGATRNSVLGKANRLKLNKQNQNQIEELTNDEKEWSRSEIRRLTTLVELGYEPEVLSKILDKDQTDIEQKLKEITQTGM